MVDDTRDNSAVNSRAFIKNSYASLLLHYRDKGLGKISDIAGATITEHLIRVIEKRFKQLGGNVERLYSRIPKPSKNGQINKKEPKR